MVVVGSIWRILYDPNIGPINQILEAVGLGNLAQAWLSQKNHRPPGDYHKRGSGVPFLSIC